MEDCLARAERLDGYRRACRTNAPNWAARDGQGYELSEISKRAELFLSESVNSIPILQGMEFAILNSEADGGLPHTRPPNLICIPKHMCKELPVSKQFRTTILHEAVHVHQRQEPEMWERFCAKEGWIPISKEIVPDEFRERCRINPDTILRPFWAWESYHVPLPLFSSHKVANLQNTNIQWLDIRTGTLHHGAPATFAEKYRQKFDQPEHPYEIYAELFSEAGISTRSELEARL